MAQREQPVTSTTCGLEAKPEWASPANSFKNYYLNQLSPNYDLQATKPSSVNASGSDDNNVQSTITTPSEEHQQYISFPLLNEDFDDD